MTKQCLSILDIETQEQCENKTDKFYDYQYGKGTVRHQNIPICDRCLEKVDIDAHFYFKKQAG
jgi:hypothetical protein